MPTVAYIAVGSNLGDRSKMIAAAIQRVGMLPRTRITGIAPFYETEPEGGPPGQPRFINGAFAVETALSPRELLDGLLAIERGLGRDRTREQRNGPRIADLDLLLYADSIIDEPGLIVPHPRLAQRRFVLQPLAEIAAEVRHPATGQTVREMLAALPAALPDRMSGS